MICQRCGREHAEGMQCICMTESAPVYMQTAPDILKQVASSGKFLAAIILSIASIVLTVIGQIMLSSSFADQMVGFLRSLNLPQEYYYQVMGQLNQLNGNTFQFISIPIMPILMVVGMLMLYFSAKRSAYGPFEAKGITLLKVLKILEIVGVALGALLFVLLAVLLGVFSASFMSTEYGYGDTEGFLAFAIGFLIGIGIMLAIVFTLIIIYNAKCIKLFNSIKNTAETGNPQAQVSGYLIVMNWISAVSTALTAFGSLALSWPSTVASLCGAASLILITLLLTEYKRKMTEFEVALRYPAQPYTGNTAYQQPAQQYQQPMQQPAYQQQMPPMQQPVQQTVQTYQEQTPPVQQPVMQQFEQPIEELPIEYADPQQPV